MRVLNGSVGSKVRMLESPMKGEAQKLELSSRHFTKFAIERWNVDHEDSTLRSRSSKDGRKGSSSTICNNSRHRIKSNSCTDIINFVCACRLVLAFHSWLEQTRDYLGGLWVPWRSGNYTPSLNTVRTPGCGRCLAHTRNMPQDELLLTANSNKNSPFREVH